MPSSNSPAPPKSNGSEHSTFTCPITAGREARRSRFPSSGFWIVSFGVLVVFMASAIPTPLYPLYQSRFVFSEMTLTWVFAAYVFATLAVLLLIGNISDHVGRRSVLLAALGAAILGSITFFVAQGVPGLLIGRALHGIAVGIFGAAGAATLADLEPSGNGMRAALFATLANMLGLVAGALTSGELAQYAPLPLRLPWCLEILLLVGVGIPIWQLHNDWRRPPPGWWRPQPLHVPAGMGRLFVATAAAGFSLSAIMGLFLALVPTLMETVLHVSGPARSGEVVAFLFAASALAELLLRHLPTRTAIVAGLGAMIVSLALIVIAEFATSSLLFWAGTFLAGIGQGLALTGVLAAINVAAPIDERSEVISSLYVFNYIGLAAPVLGIGVAIGAVGLVVATIAFAVVIGAVSLFALVVIRRVDPAQHPDMSSHRALDGCPRTA